MRQGFTAFAICANWVKGRPSDDSAFKTSSEGMPKKRDSTCGANEQDRLRYQKSRDYMVRIDDMLACKSCRRRFDIPSSQSVVFI